MAESLEAMVRRVVGEELDKRRVPRRRFVRCGQGDRMPKCWGSTIHGPDGCYCGNGP